MRFGVSILILLAVDPAESGKYGAEFVEMPGLTLRGTGCYRELVARNGSVLCMAFVKGVPKCHPAMIVRDEPDGGVVSKRVLLGSSCVPPRLDTGAIGGGSYFVQQADGGLVAWCEDGDGRSAHRDQVLKCCASEPRLAGTPQCDAALR